MFAFLIALCFVDPGQRNRYELTEIKTHDGDTITARIALGWKVTLGPESIRASNYDAWEVSRTRKTVGPITDGEIEKGKRAAKDFGELLGRGNAYLVTDGNGKRDAYGRVLGELWIKRDNEWVDVSDWMREHGHLRGAANAADKLENVTGARTRILDSTLHHVGSRRLKRIRLP